MQVSHLLSNAFLLAILVVIVIPIESFSQSPIPFHHGHILPMLHPPNHGIPRRLFLSSSSNDSEQDALLNKASQLRKEAQELEMKLSQEKGNKPAGDVAQSQAIPVTYTSLEDSSWTLSYRFASDPPPKDDDDNNKDKDSTSTDVDKKLLYYSGKVSIQLRQDGYTDILNNVDASTTPSSSSLTFSKFWGWDSEVSQEDGETYLSVSSDVVLPSKDVNYNDGVSVRFYFNAKVETDSKGVLSLRDGTVTVKRDVESPGGGFWGVFNGGGILAQFRYCGEFLVKPC